jgi:hypothetical protein
LFAPPPIVPFNDTVCPSHTDAFNPAFAVGGFVHPHPSSTLPSQLSSIPFPHTSVAPGLMFPLLSLQSPELATAPDGIPVHDVTGEFASPYPSKSASA